jgi:hypothetical protein
MKIIILFAQGLRTKSLSMYSIRHIRISTNNDTTVHHSRKHPLTSQNCTKENCRGTKRYTIFSNTKRHLQIHKNSYSLKEHVFSHVCIQGSSE